MITRDQIQTVVFQAIDGVNEVLLDEQALTKDASTVLIGAGGQLDSLGFVNFVVALEDAVARHIGLSLNVAEALNPKDAPAPDSITLADVTDLLLALAQASEREQH